VRFRPSPAGAVCRRRRLRRRPAPRFPLRVTPLSLSLVGRVAPKGVGWGKPQTPCLRPPPPYPPHKGEGEPRVTARFEQFRTLSTKVGLDSAPAERVKPARTPKRTTAMKLLRLGAKGAEKPALLAADGSYRDLSSIVPDLAGAALTPEGLAKVRAADWKSLPTLDKSLRIGACVGHVGKFICIGLNYADHAAETGAQLPKEPILFMKATSAVNGPNDDVILPKNTLKPDWEVELGVVIGKETRYIEEKDALSHIAGYCVVNDLSERHFQSERGGQWTKGKSADTFGPIGPWLVTPDEVPNPQNLKMWLEVDGHRYQNGNSSTMIFGVA